MQSVMNKKTYIVGVGEYNISHKKFNKTNIGHYLAEQLVSSLIEKGEPYDFSLRSDFDLFIFRDVVVMLPKSGYRNLGRDLSKFLSNDLRRNSRKQLTQALIVVHDEDDVEFGRADIVNDIIDTPNRKLRSIFENIQNIPITRIRVGTSIDGQYQKTLSIDAIKDFYKNVFIANQLINHSNDVGI